MLIINVGSARPIFKRASKYCLCYLFDIFMDNLCFVIFVLAINKYPRDIDPTLGQCWAGVVDRGSLGSMYLFAVEIT